MNYTLRQKFLAAELRRERVEALLITHLPNIYYLCGFSGSAGILLLQSGARGPKLMFFTDGRYTQQAREEVQGARVVIVKKPALEEACDAVVRSKIKKLSFESEHLPYIAYQQIRSMLRSRGQTAAGIELKPLAGAVEKLRAVKDPDEITNIRAAVALAAGLFPAALSAIRPGVSEVAVAGELELQARKSGAEGMSFDTIVASGPRSALPHGRASAQPIAADGFIILDYGVILAGYCSDMTRTVHVGSVSDKHRRMYDAVKAAQLASIETVRPGIETGKVDQAGRGILKKAGYGSYFTHSTGHGVGIEVHETPRLAKGQTQKLAPGMVVTIEPGIYIPDEGGVRIEDMVLVTESGHEVLTDTTKDLITL
ncbi:MAG TPA: Xaa-Pro peptidase family protein [Candidatus Angelobacter sp.]|nr:Xaa-Pro peptidase family protein [Candidatus Angelobacter sp.]